MSRTHLDLYTSIQRRRCLGWAAAAAVSPFAAALAAVPQDRRDKSPAALHRPVAQAIAEGVEQAPLTHAVLVEQHGHMLGEAYFTAEDKPSSAWFARTVAFDAGTLHDMRSISKSVVALLVGIAHGQGQLDRMRPVMDWFPEHAALATPERRAIRLDHLLTMTAGFEWDESSMSYANLKNSETRMGLALDPVGHVLSRDMVAAPGSRFAYSGGATLLLAEIIERATGREIDAFARGALFEPLGIDRFEWRRHTLWGKPLPYSGLRLAPPSMVRLGRLALDKGRHSDKVLIPADWLAQLQRPQVSHTGQALRYGWQWWVGRISEGPAAGMPWFAGLGNGGQVLMVVPSLDVTIAVTAGRYNTPASGRPSIAICRRVVEALLV